MPTSFQPHLRATLFFFLQVCFIFKSKHDIAYPPHVNRFSVYPQKSPAPLSPTTASDTVIVPLGPSSSPPRPAFPAHPNNPQLPKMPASPRELDLSSECPPSPSDTQDYRFSPTFRRSRPGCLHLTPFSVSDYLDLPHTDKDEYELIEGILYHREAGDLNHQGLLMHYSAQMYGRLSYLSNDARLQILLKDGNPCCSRRLFVFRRKFVRYT